MTSSSDRDRAAADSYAADHVDYKNIKWAFALHVLGIVVGFPSAYLSVWVVAFCSGLCQKLSANGFSLPMVLIPVAVPFLCLIVSAIICHPTMTDRHHRAVWVVTWSGFAIVVLNFILIAG